MLEIDDIKYKIINQKLYIGNFTKNKEKGYNICIQLEFINDNKEKGYINLNAGFELENNIKLFVNKEYYVIPFDSDDNQYINFEIFDTKKFLDTEIESTIKIKIYELKNNQVKALIELNDELIKLKFYGFLELNEKTLVYLRGEI